MRGHERPPKAGSVFHQPKSHGQQTEPRIWAAALFLTLLFHGAMVLGVLVTKPFAPTMVEAKRPDPIELVFAPAVEAADESDEPTFFSELPPDRADEKPEDPDFLSNIDSRARDLLAGGEKSAMPRLEGSSDAPHIRIDPAVQPSLRSEPEVAQEDPQNETIPEETPEVSESDAASQFAQTKPVPELNDTADRSRPIVAEQPQPPVPDLFLPSRGIMDFLQDEMNKPGGNAWLLGIVSINTTAWEYAPWLQEFRRRLLRSWVAPVAYYMGIVDGWTVVELEVGRNGSLRRLDVLEKNGHESLHECSADVFEALSPFRSLPVNFPEKSLILRIRLVYPPVRQR